MVESLPEIPAGTYRHYKGNLYEVLGAATHSETEEPLVVYRALYGDFGLWVRPREMFLGYLEVDGRPVPRFLPVEADTVKRLGVTAPEQSVPDGR